MGEKGHMILRRPRRLRQNKTVRALVQETHISVEDFIYPLFVMEGDGEPEPVPSMPDVHRPTFPSGGGAAAEAAGVGRRGSGHAGLARRRTTERLNNRAFL